MRREALNRKGTVAAMLALLMLPLLALLALFVDYGFLLYIRTDLQRTADQATLAAVRELVPDDEGNQDLEAVKQRLIEFVRLNLGNDIDVDDSDIEIGRYNPDTIYDEVEILDDGVFDTVRVTIRRDELVNNSVALYFARLFARDEEDVTAVSAAVLQKGRYLPPGTGVLPFAVPDTLWAGLTDGDEFEIYGDGKVLDGTGDLIPGNWGTVDIGPMDNSTDALWDQILNGLSQNDLDSLHDQGRIATTDHIDSQIPMTLNADTGLSAGIKSAVIEVEGQTKLVPIFDADTLGGASGSNLNYDIVGWGVVKVIDSRWRGNSNSYVTVAKSNIYIGLMTPNRDLSKKYNSVEGVYTSPVLVQ